MRLVRPTRLASAFLAILALASAAHAQSGSPAPMAPFAHPDPRLAAIRAAQTTTLRSPGQVALSPDATLLAWTLPTREGVTLNLTTLADPAPSKDRILTPSSATSCSSYAPVWSLDSQTLAFTSTCTSKDDAPGQTQLFLWSRASGHIRQLTHLTGIFHQAAFSPDGKSLAFLFVQNATRSAGALAAMKPWSGVIGENGIEVQRVYAVDTASGSGNFLTPANLHVFEFDFSPATPQIAFIAAAPPGENNWWIAQLYTQNTICAGICPLRSLFDPANNPTALHGLQIAVPRYSPDGRHIAFIGGLMSDQGSTGGDLWVIPSAGGTPVDVTPNLDGTPTYEAWTGPSSLGFVEDRRGHTLLADVDIATRTIDATKDLGETTISGGPIKDAISVSTHGTLAFVLSGHALAPEIYAGPFAAPKPVTHLNAGITIPPARIESVEWHNDGFTIQGWLNYPASYDPHKLYPILVQVHGGPSASAGARWGGSIYAQLGYFVFSPNPRGSFGEGEAFVQANRRDFGYGDLRDIETGLDTLEKTLPIDKQSEGITGWSYGGFMTMFAVTQTHRFRAAVAGAGISDWLSYYGENSIDQWMTPFFGATVYQDPAVYAKSSAITFIKNVTTPTLVLVGDRDGECPAPQSFEFWHALRAFGVKTQLVVYPNEGHGFVDPAHIRDREARELAWFEENMPPTP